jgi:hypothetical protein
MPISLLTTVLFIYKTAPLTARWQGTSAARWWVWGARRRRTSRSWPNQSHTRYLTCGRIRIRMDPYVGFKLLTEMNESSRFFPRQKRPVISTDTVSVKKLEYLFIVKSSKPCLKEPKSNPHWVRHQILSGSRPALSFLGQIRIRIPMKRLQIQTTVPQYWRF